MIILALAFAILGGMGLWEKHGQELWANRHNLCFADSHGTKATGLPAGKACFRTFPCPPLLTCHAGAVILPAVKLPASPTPTDGHKEAPAAKRQQQKQPEATPEPEPEYEVDHEEEADWEDEDWSDEEDFDEEEFDLDDFEFEIEEEDEQQQH